MKIAWYSPVDEEVKPTRYTEFMKKFIETVANLPFEKCRSNRKRRHRLKGAVRWLSKSN